MKKRLRYINLGLMLLVILTLAVQSIHIYYHQHNHIIDIDHVCDGQHDHDDDNEACHVCDFVFSFFVGQPFFFHPFPEKFNPVVSDGLALNKPTLSNIQAYPKRGPPMKW